MFKKIKDAAGKAAGSVVSTASAAATHVGDLNGDGKVDAADAKIAADWARQTATDVGEGAARLAKTAARSDMAREAAVGAGIGAAIALPVPFVGPALGAAAGAAFGVYGNLTAKGRTASPPRIEAEVDVPADLLKLDDLRQKGLLSEEEFAAKKKRLLKKL